MDSQLTLTDDPSGILIMEYPLHAILSRELLDEEKALLDETNKRPVRYLIKLRGVALVDQDITSYIASHYSGLDLRAVAIFFDSRFGYYEHGKLMIDAFLNHSALNFPVQKFDDENEAMKWLLSQ